MSKTYLPYEPDQQLLLPAALQEWLPEDHLAYFISDVVDQLDMSEVTARYERERRGGPPYHPRMMVKALLYGYCVGVASSRRIAQRLHEDIAFRVLAANNTPDFRTISDFRKDNLDALSGLFIQVLALCQKAGLVKLGHVALYSILDGHSGKAAAIESLPWFGLEMGASAWDRTLELIRLADYDYVDERVFWAVMDRPWAGDGLTADEATLISAIRGLPAEYALRLLEMPFLESVEGIDAAAMYAMRIMSFREGGVYLKELLSLSTVSDGITDNEAFRFAVLRIVDPSWLESLAPVILDPERASLSQRAVSLPLAGNTTLAVVEVGSGASVSLDTLERIVRAQEAFMGVPLPTSYVALLAADANRLGGAGSRWEVITVDPSFRGSPNTVAHEAGHIYRSSGYSWIAEGGASLMEMITLNAMFSTAIGSPFTGCTLARNIGEFEQVADDLYASGPTSAFDTIYGSGCSYSLGQGLFLDLHRELGRDTFRQGLARL